MKIIRFRSRLTLAIASILVLAGGGAAAAAVAASPGQPCRSVGSMLRVRGGMTLQCVAPRSRQWVLIAPATVTATVTVTAERGLGRSMPGNGMYRVGVDIRPGTWRSNNAQDQSCYWARRDRAGDGVDGVLDSDFAMGPQIVTILASDRYFKTSRCASWVLIGQSSVVSTTTSSVSTTSSARTSTTTRVPRTTATAPYPTSTAPLVSSP